MSKVKLEKIAFKMQLNSGQAAEYERRHDAIPSALTALLRDAGVQDYSIFLDEETNVLFAVLWRSLDHKMEDLPTSQVMQDWWAHMSDIMETDEGNVPSTASLKRVFHME